MKLQNNQSGTEVAQSGTEKVRRVGRSHVDYWTPRLKKRSYEWEGRTVEIPEWQVRIAHLGRREWFNTSTPNKAIAAEKARKIYLSLIAKGWQATLDEFKPDMQVANDGCTVGEFLEQVKAVSGLKPVTFEIYAKKFRSVVAGAFGIDGGKAKHDYVHGGHKEWLARVCAKRRGYHRQAATRIVQDCYRRNLWTQQSAHVEIWGEKDAISGILYREANTFGVKVFTCRGFASLSALYSAANTFKNAVANGKKVFIYYFGDHDPSGLAIDRAAVASFRHDFGVEVELTRAAVTPIQIILHSLPTRPVKKTDTRAGGWQGGCVEVDTMPPTVLKALVRNCITQHIDRHQWEQTQAIEAAERETLRQFAANVGVPARSLELRHHKFPACIRFCSHDPRPDLES